MPNRHRNFAGETCLEFSGDRGSSGEGDGVSVGRALLALARARAERVALKERDDLHKVWVGYSLMSFKRNLSRTNVRFRRIKVSIVSYCRPSLRGKDCFGSVVNTSSKVLQSGRVFRGYFCKLWGATTYFFLIFVLQKAILGIFRLF